MPKAKAKKKTNKNAQYIPLADRPPAAVRLSPEEIELIAHHVFVRLRREHGPFRFPGETDKQVEKRIDKFRARVRAALQAEFGQDSGGEK